MNVQATWKHIRPRIGRAALLLACLLSAAPGRGQEPPAAPAVEQERGAYQLALSQEQVAARWKRFEEVLLRVAELTARTDPDRAALLRQAVAESKERLVGMQFQELVKLLRSDKLAGAVKGQQDLENDLKALLELLLSEDRAKRLADEQARIREYLKKVNQLIKEEKAIQGATEGSGDPAKLAERQAQTAGKTAKLAGQIQDDAAAGQSGRPSDADAEAGEDASDKQSRDNKPADKQPGEEGESPDKQQPEDNESDDKESGNPQPGDAPPSESQPGQPQDGQPQGGQPQQGPPQQGQSQQGDQGESPDSPNQPSGEPPTTDPAQQRLQAAQQRMKQAQQQLEKARKRQAAEAEEAAIHELEQAKAELEEILRQLREEEMKRVLTMLEERFRKMLHAQTIVYEGTLRLDGVPVAERGRDDEIEAGRLSSREAEIVVEANKALLLLGDDGTAVALPEALTQAREDMRQVVERLAQNNVDQLTQGIEEDIIAALEEMIAVLQKELAELEEGDQQPPPPGQQGEPGEPPLVDALAELKMIRSLQMRVNNRTQRYTDLIEGEQAAEPELLEALRDLARRQERIYRATRDIVVGRNK